MSSLEPWDDPGAWTDRERRPEVDAAVLRTLRGLGGGRLAWLLALIASFEPMEMINKNRRPSLAVRFDFT